jgi:hypothetical protein
MSQEEFNTVVRTRALNGNEWAAKENLDAINFLLGDDAEILEAS